MTEPLIHELRSDFWQVGILPATGGSVAFAKIKVGDSWVDFMRPTPLEDLGHVGKTASYCLIPWSNRIRDHRFMFRGLMYELMSSWPDGTAIHGVARDYPWQVAPSDGATTQDQLLLTFQSADKTNVNFPFLFSATLRFQLTNGKFSIDTTLTNEDSRAMPAGIGHHPYFQRTLTSPTDEVMLEIPFDQHFILENDLPIYQPAVDLDPRLEFRTLRPIGDVLIDDCYTARQPNKPVRFKYAESGVEIQLVSDPVFQSLVLYAPVEKPYFAVEPVTNANDGFNLLARGIANHHVIELEPGQTLSGSVTFEKIS